MPVRNIFAGSDSSDTASVSGAVPLSASATLTTAFGPSPATSKGSRAVMMAPSNPLGLTWWLGVAGIVLLVVVHYSLPK